MVDRRIHKSTEGKSFTEGNWNDCQLFGEPMKIGRQQEGDTSRKRGNGCK
jgi:hypothetical protein